MNLAEGNGQGADTDRRRLFEIARGSALECGQRSDTKTMRCGKMLTALITLVTTMTNDNDNDNDNDSQRQRFHRYSLMDLCNLLMNRSLAPHARSARP
ncbi:hypothetical protein CCR95_02935 [Thiocystis minor]|nr:hypothetical protein [Thiocystis minor]